MKHDCPVCGLKEIFSDWGSYEICPQCNWEDDPVQNNDPDYEGGANALSLNQERKKWEKREQLKDKNMLKAVIFDFDGVVADSEFLHYQALNTIFKRFGVDISKDEHWATYLGYSDLENIEAVNRDYDMGLDDAAIQEQIAEKKIVFDELAKTDAVIIDGVAEFIGMLVDNKVRIAICSGALRSDIDLMLDGAAFKDVFEEIVTADDVTHGKPDPEGYLLALEKLNAAGGEPIKPEECIVIEDSHWGLEAAVAAGMNPIAVTNSYPADQLDGKACKIVDRLDVLTMEDLRGICR